MKNNLFVTVGTPGTGKSYQLIQKVIELEKQGEACYIMAPTHTAKERLLSGFRENVKNGNLTIDEFFNTVGSVHVLEHNYNDEKNIFIDEFSMISIDTWHSILYKIMTVNDDINIYTYGDAKQLPPVHGISPLLLLLLNNYQNFTGINSVPFSEYSAKKLYKNLKDTKLDVPDNWKLAINQVYLTVLHDNYRLEEIDGINDYDEHFYQYILENNLISDDYEEYLTHFSQEKYLIVTPTHKIGEEADEILKENLVPEKDNDKLAEIAPFIRINQRQVYINPRCKINYGFDGFIHSVDDSMNLNGAKYSFYVTTHSTQGATVDNMVYYTGDNEIDPRAKEFYNNNLLYTALSRAKYNSYFLGSETMFLTMINTFTETDVSFLNTQLQNEALDLTYHMVINAGNTLGRMTNQQIIDLYHKNFKKVSSQPKSLVKIKNIKLIDPNFKIKPFSDKKIISVMNPSAKTEIQIKYKNDLELLGYGFHYLQWQKEQLEKGNKKGGEVAGKISPVREWFNNLNDDIKQQVKNDLDLSQRKFQRKYHKSKAQVIKYI